MEDKAKEVQQIGVRLTEDMKLESLFIGDIRLPADLCYLIAENVEMDKQGELLSFLQENASFVSNTANAVAEGTIH